LYKDDICTYFCSLLILRKGGKMAIMITEECINCGACEPECPNTAIYEGGVQWSYAGGTSLEEIELEDGSSMDAKELQEPISPEFYYIVPNKCTECLGFHEEPQCAAVCPVDCCVDDPDVREEDEILLAKKAWLHAE
jgi:ferredoxin